MLLKRAVPELPKCLGIPVACCLRRSLTQHQMCNFSLFGGDIITAQLACQRKLIAFPEHLFLGTAKVSWTGLKTYIKLSTATPTNSNIK